MQQGRLTTFFVFVAMVGQSLLGCCVHHSHAEEHVADSHDPHDSAPSLCEHGVAGHDEEDQTSETSHILIGEVPGDDGHCPGDDKCRFVRMANDQALSSSPLGATHPSSERLTSRRPVESRLLRSSFQPITPTLSARSRAQIWQL